MDNYFWNFFLIKKGIFSNSEAVSRATNNGKSLKISQSRGCEIFK